MYKPRLFHYSPHVIHRLQQKRHYKWDLKNWEDPKLQCRRNPGKPWGFWVSVGHSWAQWCERETFRLEGLKYQYEVKLKKDANILVLNNIEHFDAFCYEYGYNPYEEHRKWVAKSDTQFHDATDRLAKFLYDMDHFYYPDVRWDLIKQRHQGVLIYPYFHERRLMTSSAQWYYGWDCASGCIWDISAIDKFQLHKMNRVKRRAVNKDYEPIPQMDFGYISKRQKTVVENPTVEADDSTTIIPGPGSTDEQFGGFIADAVRSIIRESGQKEAITASQGVL